jgi:hypothetical protein
MPTNAIATVVLSAELLLPALNQFAGKLDLDMELPLRTNQITHVWVDKRQKGISITFNERHLFCWNHDSNYVGKIAEYNDKKFSTAWLEDEKDLMLLSQKAARISTNEARAIAEAALKKLGWDPVKFKLRSPKVSQYKYEEESWKPLRPLPLFHVRWYSKGEPDDSPFPAFEIQVSGLTKKITSYEDLFRTKDTRIDLRMFMTNSTQGLSKKVEQRK